MKCSPGIFRKVEIGNHWNHWIYFTVFNLKILLVLTSGLTSQSKSLVRHLWSIILNTVIYFINSLNVFLIFLFFVLFNMSYVFVMDNFTSKHISITKFETVLQGSASLLLNVNELRLTKILDNIIYRCHLVLHLR